MLVLIACFFVVIKGHYMPIKASTPSSVLLVCLGNICRSPTAEEIFRQQAAIAGLAMKVDSAGTGDWHIGHAPDVRAQRQFGKFAICVADAIFNGLQVG